MDTIKYFYLYSFYTPLNLVSKSLGTLRENKNHWLISAGQVLSKNLIINTTTCIHHNIPMLCILLCFTSNKPRFSLQVLLILKPSHFQIWQNKFPGAVKAWYFHDSWGGYIWRFSNRITPTLGIVTVKDLIFYLTYKWTT